MAKEPQDTEKKEFTPKEVLERVIGLDRNTLNNWRRAGYIQAKKRMVGEKPVYYYTEREVARVRYMHELTKKGLSPKNAYKKARETLHSWPSSATCYISSDLPEVWIHENILEWTDRLDTRGGRPELVFVVDQKKERTKIDVFIYLGDNNEWTDSIEVQQGLMQALVRYLDNVIDKDRMTVSEIAETISRIAKEDIGEQGIVEFTNKIRKTIQERKATPDSDNPDPENSSSESDEP